LVTGSKKIADDFVKGDERKKLNKHSDYKNDV